MLLAAVVEQVTGRPFDEVLKAADHTAAEAAKDAVSPRSKIYKGLPFGPLCGPNGSLVRTRPAGR